MQNIKLLHINKGLEGQFTTQIMQKSPVINSRIHPQTPLKVKVFPQFALLGRREKDGFNAWKFRNFGPYGSKENNIT